MMTQFDNTGATFRRLGLDERLADALEAAGLTEPTPIQAEAIPVLLTGRDAVLQAPTGSGKTLAYLLPALQRIDPGRKETQAIVVAPTQELAMQIFRVAETFGPAVGVRAASLIGGASLSRQLDKLKSKPALVVGTPGRIREVAALRKLPLQHVRMIVVDETDRVFALGGRADVEHLLKGAARDRLTVFVSATRPEPMREAEARWLRAPWTASPDGSAGDAGGLPASIAHWFLTCDRRDKIDLTRRLIRHLRPKSALLFVNDTDRIAELTAKLRYEGFAVEALYGDTGGRDRGDALRKFREGRIQLLVATDLAARGLDVPGLPLVIQLEPALDADHYVHRAGRTGRMGREGLSVTIVAPQERFVIGKLAKRLGIRIEEKALHEGRIVSPDEAPRRRRAGVSGTPADRDVAAPAGRRSVEAPAGRPGVAAPSGRRGAVAPAGKPGADALPRRRAGTAGPTDRADTARSVAVRGPSGGGLPAKSAVPAHRPAPAKPPAKPAKAKADRERERDRKNKGAPRWLKEKRGQLPPRS